MSMIETALAAAKPVTYGRLVEVKGLHLLARGVDAAVGEILDIHGADAVVPAEVVASTAEGTVCLPLRATTGLRVGARVRATGSALRVPVGPELLGRVVDGLGRPLDGGPSLLPLQQV
ncbi:MAG: EscN/YscN/HrcN family type III secretion system ATPase, partial [Nocardioidaceae bacterium]